MRLPSLEEISIGLSLLKEIFKIIKKPKKIVRIEKEEVENLQELQKKIEDLRKMENIEEIKNAKELVEIGEKFFRENFITYVEDERKWFIIPKEMSYEEVINKLSKSKTKELKESFLITSIKFGLQTEEFKERSKEIGKNIMDIIQLLPEQKQLRFKSLIALAIHTEQLYNEDRTDEAEIIRGNIKTFYGDFGLKFCNLYQRNYLKKFFISLQGKDPVTIEKEINGFFEDAEYIFFIHKSMTLEDIDWTKSQIRSAFDDNWEYIAIHSLGGATAFAENIEKEITSPEGYNHRKIDESKRERNIRDLTLIWYKGEKGERFLQLLDC